MSTNKARIYKPNQNENSWIYILYTEREGMKVNLTAPYSRHKDAVNIGHCELEEVEYIKDSECFGVTGLNKDENIKLIVNRNNLKYPVYVGDTQGDFLACESSGVPFIFAGYGFGSVDESKCAGVINSPVDLLKLL